MQNEILELTQKLISFKTVTSDTKEISACCDFIESYFSQEIKAGKIILKKYWKNNAISLVFSNRKTLNYDILLNGHIDVVQAEKSEFTPKIKDGMLFGRGAGDMKCEIATIMIIFKELINENCQKSVALMLNSDEEIGGHSGADYLVNEIGYTSKIVISPDGGNNFELNIKDKGLFWVKISATGKTGHASRTWLGDNAILKLFGFYKDIERSFPPLKKIKSLYQDGVSLNLGVISGGNTINMIPEKAEMSLDMRYSDKKDKERILKTIEKLAKKNKVSYEIINSAEMFEISLNDPYLKKFKAMAEKILGRKMKTIRSTGAGDNRFFSAKGMPVIISGPNFGNEHSSGEWLEIKSLENFYIILKQFIKEIN